MSIEKSEFYRTKQRRLAFYIVENEKLNNDENPPMLSAVIGLDKELEVAFNTTKRKPQEKTNYETGLRIRRSKKGIQCPSVPSEWINNGEIIIPKAVFGHFTIMRK